MKAKFTKGQKVIYAGNEATIKSVTEHYDGTIYYKLTYYTKNAFGDVVRFGVEVTENELNN